MTPDTWLEVSLTVDGEMAEAVAEVLARFVPNGVVIETTAIEPDPAGEGFPSERLRVCGYLPVDDHLEDTRRRLEESLWYLGRIHPLPFPQFRPIQESDWSEAWKQHYRPMAIGRSLLIVPAWMESPDPSRTAIHINPGMAFGTGTHPTTQLCLEFVEEFLETRYLADTGFLNVIDVGCGSGILSIAALKLGAQRALGVDVDPAAIIVARENAAANGVEDRLELGLGSVVELRTGAFSIQQAPLVLANILAPVIVRLLDQGLGDLLAPGGRLLLSGILKEQAVDVEDAAQKHDLCVVDRRQAEDWVAVCLTRKRV